MIEKLLLKIPHIKRLKEENENLKRVNQWQGRVIERQKECNSELIMKKDQYASLLGYLVNEGHYIIANQAKRRHIYVDPQRLKPYQDGTKIELKETAPQKGYLLYASIIKGRRK